MSKKSTLWFNWHCPHCEHRNRLTFSSGQFELPNRYTIRRICEGCGKQSELGFDFTVNGWWKEKKAPKIRKIRQNEKNRRKKAEADFEGDPQRNKVYKNDRNKIEHMN